MKKQDTAGIDPAGPDRDGGTRRTGRTRRTGLAIGTALFGGLMVSILVLAHEVGKAMHSQVFARDRLLERAIDMAARRDAHDNRNSERDPDAPHR